MTEKGGVGAGMRSRGGKGQDRKPVQHTAASNKETPFQAWQVDVICWIQATVGVSQQRIVPSMLRLVSVCGSGRFIFPCIVLSMWFLDADIGFRFLQQLAFCLGVMSTNKTFFAMPRPPFVSDRAQHFDPTLETSFGFPSGHTLCMVAMLGYLCYGWGGVAAQVVHAVFVVLTCVSRLYTGAHFVVDVIGGLVLGSGILLVSLWTDLQWMSPPVCMAISVILTMTCLTTRDDTTGHVKVKLVAEGYQGIGVSAGVAVSSFLTRAGECTPVTGGAVAGLATFVGMAILCVGQFGYLDKVLEDKQRARSIPNFFIGALVTAVGIVWSAWVGPCVIHHHL